MTKSVDGDSGDGLRPTASSTSRIPEVSPKEAEGRDFSSKLAAKRLQNQNGHDNNNILSSQNQLRYRIKLIGTWWTRTQCATQARIKVDVGPRQRIIVGPPE